jgi:hypothetical protein
VLDLIRTAGIFLWDLGFCLEERNVLAEAGIHALELSRPNPLQEKISDCKRQLARPSGIKEDNIKTNAKRANMWVCDQDLALLTRGPVTDFCER